MKSKPNMTNPGGYHPDPDISKWPSGSIFEVEGRRLFDLVVDIKPDRVIEIGGFYGCSTTWIAKALKKNKKGKVISIDNHVNGGYWDLVPEQLSTYIIRHTNNIFKMNPAEDPLFDGGCEMLFFDGPKIDGAMTKMYHLFKPSKVFVTHDYSHRTEGKIIQPEFDELFGQPDEIFFEDPTDCGLAIKFFDQKKPGNKKSK